MEVGIFGKSLSRDGIIYLQQLIDKLKSENCSLNIYKPYFEKIKDHVSIKCESRTFSTHFELKDNAEILFSIGGDGTLLDTIAFVRDSGIPVLGVNLGRLGFLSSISRDEILPAIDHVISGNYHLDERTLLQLKSPDGLFGEINYALNELSITKTDSNSLAVVSVYLNDRFLNTYWADGLLVATPTGSTAYSLSCYGPIITPGSENFVITPIASHNLTVRPIVIPDNQKISLRLGGRNNFYRVGLDSRYQTINNTVELVIDRAAFKINLIQLPNKDFYSTIREKLLWGKDQRN
ncbi:MAG: NAD kinase [Bacteroidales bacterium]|nr:NAD kinase [Bacteroidales bacterium]